MVIDEPYYKAIVDFIQAKDNTKYIVSDLTDSPDKFIFHVEHYIKNRGEGLIVKFSSDKNFLTVLEFFESIYLRYEEGKIIEMDEVERREHILKVSAEFIAEEKRAKISKGNKGLFQ